MYHVELINRDGLTPRQADVLKAIAEGKPNKVIARELAISIRSVEAESTQIIERMKIRQGAINARCVLLAEAIVRGMVKLSSTALVWLLLVSAAVQDDPVMRSGRVNLIKPAAMRSLRKGDA